MTDVPRIVFVVQRTSSASVCLVTLRIRRRLQRARVSVDCSTNHNRARRSSFARAMAREAHLGVMTPWASTSHAARDVDGTDMTSRVARCALPMRSLGCRASAFFDARRHARRRTPRGDDGVGAFCLDFRQCARAWPCRRRAAVVFVLTIEISLHRHALRRVDDAQTADIPRWTQSRGCESE